MTIELPIYLDYAATTPIDPRVAELMMECLGAKGPHGNPSSVGHEHGRRARKLVEEARARVAKAIGTQPACIIWTSGATESNNFALFGAARFNRERGRHIVSSSTEHKAVLDTLKQLEREGFEVTYLQPGPSGVITPQQVIDALRPDTVLVSLMHVNNEIGVIQDIAAVGRACRERGIAFHVDAAQSAGKLPIDVESACIDLMSLTAHKCYGPKGIGVLYMRRAAGIGVQPLIYGGGQEYGLRSGTLATHQIVGMGAALSLAVADMAEDNARISELRDRLWKGIQTIGGVELNGDPQQRVPGVLNITFHDVADGDLQFALRDLAVSAGSACSSGSDMPSHVLHAIGRSKDLAQSSLRFSLGRFTTLEEVDATIAVLQRELPRLRSVSLVSAIR